MWTLFTSTHLNFRSASGFDWWVRAINNPLPSKSWNQQYLCLKQNSLHFAFFFSSSLDHWHIYPKQSQVFEPFSSSFSNPYFFQIQSKKVKHELVWFLGIFQEMYITSIQHSMGWWFFSLQQVFLLEVWKWNLHLKRMFHFFHTTCFITMINFSYYSIFFFFHISFRFKAWVFDSTSTKNIQQEAHIIVHT